MTNDFEGPKKAGKLLVCILAMVFATAAIATAQQASPEQTASPPTTLTGSTDTQDENLRQEPVSEKKTTGIGAESGLPVVTRDSIAPSQGPAAEKAKKDLREWQDISAAPYRDMKSTGQSGDTQDFLEIYRLARENDPAFQNEKYKHEASPEALKQAYAEILPSVSANLYYQGTRQEIISTDVAIYGDDLAKYSSNGITLTLTQALIDQPSFKRISQAKEEVNKADLEFDAAKQDLILRVAEAYIGALEAFDNLVFTSAKENALNQTFQLAQGRFNSGLAPITDYHDAKARLASVMADRLRAENRLDDALEALTVVAGQSIDNIARLKYALSAGRPGDDSAREGIPMVNPDPDDVRSWTNAALDRNLQVQIREKAVLVAQREIERQEGGHYPILALVGRLDQDYQGGSLYGGESEVRRADAMLQLNIPLYEGMSVTSKVRAARKNHAAAKEDLEKETRNVKRETRAAFLGVKAAIKNTEALGQSVISTQIALEAKREGFNSGLFPSLVVLDAERDLHFAKTEYASAHYDYIRNSLRLKKVVGSLGETDIEEINQWLE